ncbi:MAG: CoA-binding protein [Bacillota bacterium]
MYDLIEKALSMKNWAVVGATQNTSKFGYRVYKKLKNHNYGVFPVNPQYQDIEGTRCYSHLRDIEERIEAVSMVINPVKGLEMLQEAENKDIKIIWCQPGAESEEIIDFAKSKGIDIIYNECLLVELG